MSPNKSHMGRTVKIQTHRPQGRRYTKSLLGASHTSSPCVSCEQGPLSCVLLRFCVCVSLFLTHPKQAQLCLLLPTTISWRMPSAHHTTARPLRSLFTFLSEIYYFLLFMKKIKKLLNKNMRLRNFLFKK